MWQRLADSDKAPCSPCSRLEIDQCMTSLAELDLLALVQPVGDGAPELHDHVERHHRHGGHVERLVEIDVVLVQRVPEMVVGGRNNAVEGIAAPAVTRYFQHRWEVFRHDSDIGLVVGDLLGHFGPPM